MWSRGARETNCVKCHNGVTPSKIKKFLISSCFLNLNSSYLDLPLCFLSLNSICQTNFTLSSLNELENSIMSIKRTHFFDFMSLILKIYRI